jgi:hypothetical protein
MDQVVMDRAKGRAAKEDGQQIALSFAGSWGEDVLGELHQWLQRRKAAG